MVELISSEVLEDEVGRNPSAERRLEGETLVSFASQKVLLNVRIVRRGRELSAAEFAKAAVLLSTDDRFVRRATRGDGYPNIPVQNPVLSIQEFST